jgi:hypothetical protein
MQVLVVALLVAACSIYAAWVLMPGIARRALATTLLKMPMPSALAGRLRKAATASSGCGCDGCDAAPAPAPAVKSATQVVTFHPRPPR